MICDDAYIEPPGRNQDDERKTDIEFRDLNADGTKNNRAVNCGGYQSLDIVMPSTWLKLIDKKEPPEDMAYWATSWSKKAKSTTIAYHSSSPHMVASTLEQWNGSSGV